VQRESLTAEGDPSGPGGLSGGKPTPMERRPLASRDQRWARWLAARLAASAVTPNQISGCSVLAAAFGAACVLWWTGPLGWLVAAVAVQLRLLCNLLDGMVAIEGGKASAVGALWNELPDRVADALLIVPVGYAIGRPWLGWAAALLATLTAYVRVLGGALGLPQSFSGIMAKQRRMAALTLGLVAQAVESALFGGRLSLTAALAVIAIGSAVTCATRTVAIGRQLER
jgi:phosphatidylglycerophosphate synthase